MFKRIRAVVPSTESMREEWTVTCTGHPSDGPDPPGLEPQNQTKPECNNHARGCDAAREVTRQVFCFEFQAIRASQGVQGQPGQHGKSETSLSCGASWRPAWTAD